MLHFFLALMAVAAALVIVLVAVAHWPFLIALVLTVGPAMWLFEHVAKAVRSPQSRPVPAR